MSKPRNQQVSHVMVKEHKRAKISITKHFKTYLEPDYPNNGEVVTSKGMTPAKYKTQALCVEHVLT